MSPNELPEENIGSPETPSTPQYDVVLQRLSFLQEALVTQDPEIKNHLKEIHRLMITHEELVHLLKDDEIAIIMTAQQGITNTTLVAAVTSAKGKVAASKKAATLGMGDL